MPRVYNSNERSFSALCYSDIIAEDYTRRQVNKIRNLGYNVISYFISESNVPYQSDMTSFRRMYGQDSQFLNVNSLSQIANSFNSKLMETYTV
jgi:hypothetical protein